jgi:4,4'-diaponeurosporenoate glycosyltransferase
MIFLLTSLILIVPYLALLLYYRRSWDQIPDYSSDHLFTKENTEFISVIIPARNEEKNIRQCLASLMNQTYPHNSFEVLVMDDHSSDTTVKIASEFPAECVRIFKLSEYLEGTELNSYKKKAVETAISHSLGSLIVTTDADCILPPKWLETIASFHKSYDAVFIAAPVMFYSESGKKSGWKKFLFTFQILDFMVLQEITGASVFKKFHNMCNGANLAYEKKAFYETGGFSGIDDIASGDDMLLMQKFQKIYPDKIHYLKSGDAIVQTKAAETLREFISQRIRWASKADRYSDKKITWVLVLVYIFNLWMIILAICAFFYNNLFYLLLILLVIKTLVECYFLLPAARFFKKTYSLWWFIPSQPCHILYTVVAGWLGKFGKYRWKGRPVR